MPGRTFYPYGHGQIFLWPPSCFCTTHNLLTLWTTTRRLAGCGKTIVAQ